MTHTKEPWEVLGFNFPQIVDAKGCVAMMAPDALMPIQIANAKRIVACVNACAGITNDALEAGVVRHSIGEFMQDTDHYEDTPVFYDLPLMTDAEGRKG